MADSVKHALRKRIWRATVLTIMRDERIKRMLLRTQGSNPDGERFMGIIGQAKEYGSGTSTKINAETSRLIKQLATPYLGAPYTCVQTSMDQDFYDHMIKITRAVCIDSAENEVAAARTAMLDCTEAARNNNDRALLPNCDTIIRDKAHASRRILTRPWECDEVFKSVVTLLVTGKKSISQLVENSHIFQQWYKEASANSATKATTSTFQHLRARKHRFEANATPLHRLTSDPEAAYDFLNRVIVSRPGTTDAADAKRYIEVLDEEVWFLAALLADMADDGLQFTRIWDEANPSTSSMNSDVKRFLDKITALYWDFGIIGVPGHLCFMCEWLSKVHTFFVNGEIRQVGGPGTIERLLASHKGRTRSWVTVARSVTIAEFPNFEIVAAFDVFELDDWDCAGLSVERKQNLARLAKKFNVNFERLCLQFLDHGNRAQKLKAQKGLDVHEAWKQAIAHVSSKHVVQERHPCDALGPVFAAFGGMPCSTCSLEQNFSVFKRVMGEHRLGSGESSEECRMQVIFCPPEWHAEVVKQAQVIWAHLYKPSRHHNCYRFDKGLKRARDDTKQNELDPSPSFHHAPDSIGTLWAPHLTKCPAAPMVISWLAPDAHASIAACIHILR